MHLPPPKPIMMEIFLSFSRLVTESTCWKEASFAITHSNWRLLSDKLSSIISDTLFLTLLPEMIAILFIFILALILSHTSDDGEKFNLMP